MITEDYVSFETAKLLKEKGFQQLQNNCGYFTTEMVYSIDTDDNGEHHFAHQYPAGVYNKDKYIAAPTLQMAMKWLREVHGIHIQAYCPVLDLEVDITRVKYNVVISNLKGYCIAFDTDIEDKEYDSPEEAYEAAIRYCLENLI